MRAGALQLITLTILNRCWVESICVHDKKAQGGSGWVRTAVPPFVTQLYHEAKRLERNSLKKIAVPTLCLVREAHELVV